MKKLGQVLRSSLESSRKLSGLQFGRGAGGHGLTFTAFGGVRLLPLLRGPSTKSRPSRAKLLFLLLGFGVTYFRKSPDDPQPCYT